MAAARPRTEPTAVDAGTTTRVGGIALGLGGTVGLSDEDPDA